ncbi:MAG: hypothetical protein BWY38_03270 [Ignavibacteria bacterium ADurb.Bin266]|mgnify:FL=1|nr:MAG: hypothetical protein BWY38_03270 [Ignavibacteria bacterium ADurb.Bin266]
MRIITWNCRYGFSEEKINHIAKFNPDLLIIQECMEPDLLDCKKVWSNVDWYGDHLEFNKYKKGGDLGIGIFSNKYTFSITKFHNSAIRYVVPYKVKTEDREIYLFSTWTKTEGCKKPYIGQINEALNYPGYQSLLNDSIFIGDFNANKIWDIKENVNSFENALSSFKSHNMKSIYHEFNNECFGQEKQATSYQSQGNYHIDYCFVPKTAKVHNVELKEFEKIKLSDHLPMIIDLSL